jgi:hypothetical protein
MIGNEDRQPASIHRSAFLRLGAILFMLTLVGTAFSQSDKKGEPKERSVQGFVIDSNGNPVPNAVVQLKNVRTQQIRSFIAQNKGDFFFSGLNPDVDYEIRAEYDGASSATRTLSAYDGRKQFVFTLKLTAVKPTK